MPRQIRETRSPLAPRFTYSMGRLPSSLRGPCAISLWPSPARCATSCARTAGRDEREQVSHPALDARRELIDVGGAVVVAGDAEVEPAVVAEDRDHDADGSDDGHEGVGLEHPPPERLHGLLWPGHVGGGGVHVQPR